MLIKKLRKNLDWIFVLLFITVVYMGGWQAEVFGFIQRGVLATGLLNANAENEMEAQSVELDFKVADMHGKEMAVSSLQGKVIFINFWATWCPPCIAEMPGINALYNSLKEDDSIVFLVISVDMEQDKAKAFMDRKPFGFPLLFPASTLPDELAYQSIPATYVISPQGKLVYQKKGLAQYDTDEFRTFLQTL